MNCEHRQEAWIESKHKYSIFCLLTGVWDICGTKHCPIKHEEKQMNRAEKMLEMQARMLRVEIRMHAMTAENQLRAAANESPAYTHKQFLDLIDEEGLSYNEVLRDFQND